MKFSRWITPALVKTRFDTHFFLATLPDGQEPRSTARSASTSAGSPRRTRSAPTRSEEILLVFPTIKHLEQLGEFATVEALLDYARGREVSPVEPRVVVEGEVARILLPGEDGY